MKNAMVNYSATVPAIFDRNEFLTPFSSLFDEIFNSSFPTLHFGNEFFEKGTYPKVDVVDEENHITIEAEIPGLTKEQVSVEIDNGVLRIKGEKKDVCDNTSKKYVHRELKRSAFCRSFSVGNNIDESKIDAKFDNGILRIILLKKVPDVKQEKAKKVEIK